MHILLIEDETFLAKVLSNTLTKADYKVTCIEDGLQAWEHLQQNRTTYDLILMDRGLPGMDGLSLLKNIKQESDLAQIPVVIETGMDDGDSVQEGLSAGAYYYLTKPVHHQLLLTVIESALNEYHQNQEMQEAILDAQNTLEFLEHGYFSCQTLEQSKQLAKVLAKAFPEPQKAILGLSELLINAVEHGNLAISYDEKTKMMMDGTLHDEIKKRLSHPLYQNRRVRIELTKKNRNDFSDYC